MDAETLKSDIGFGTAMKAASSENAIGRVGTGDGNFLPALPSLNTEPTSLLAGAKV